MSWTDDQVTTLREMWAEGCYASDIAVVVDKSRNAVIGKAHRCGCAARPSPIGMTGVQPWHAEGRTAFPKGKKPEHFVRHEHVRKGILDGRPVSPFKTCQWIAGEPSADDSCKCGKRTAEGRSYCQAHAERAYRFTGDAPRAPGRWTIPTMTLTHDEALTALEKAG